MRRMRALRAKEGVTAPQAPRLRSPTRSRSQLKTPPRSVSIIEPINSGVVGTNGRSGSERMREMRELRAQDASRRSTASNKTIKTPTRGQGRWNAQVEGHVEDDIAQLRAQLNSLHAEPHHY